MSRLLKSITTSDQQVIATTTTIIADNSKRDDFATPKKQGGRNKQQRVSTIYQSWRQDKGKRKVKIQVGKTGVEFRYYKKMEFDHLTQE